MAAMAVLQEMSTMVTTSEALATVCEAASTAPWFVLMTRPRVERQAARDIESLGLEAYYPKGVRFGGRSMRQRLSRRIISLLFPGYLFVRGCAVDDVVRIAREAPLVQGAVCAIDRPLRAMAATIEKIQRFEVEGQFDETRPTAVRRRGVKGFKVGQRVQLTEGPLMWLKGVVTALDADRSYAKVDLTLFGGSTPIDVPIDLLVLLR